MASPTAKKEETSAMTPHQKFKGHTDFVQGVIHLPGGQRIITCSEDGSLRVWNLKSGKQIGEDWRGGEGGVCCIALSPDGKKMVSGSEDGAVRLWDIDTCKVIGKWMGHTQRVLSVCWSRDSRSVLSGSPDGTARQWEVESRETILEPIKTGHTYMYAVVYSPDMSMIATGGYDGPRRAGEHIECSIKIWNTKTGELVATLKGHTWVVGCLAWTNDGKTLISGSSDSSIRTWNTKTWKQTTLLEAHTRWVRAIAISPNDRILASASHDQTVLLWNLDDGQLIGPPLQHANYVYCVSFSVDGKLLATGCQDKNVYTWDVAAIVQEAGLDGLLSDPKANKLALHASATRPPVQRPPSTHRIAQGFFDGVPPDRSHSSARSHPHSSVPPGSTFLGRLFYRNCSTSGAYTTPLSTPLDWVRNILKRRARRDEDIQLQGRSLAVVEAPYAKGKRRNACAREKRKRPFPSKNPMASRSRPPKPSVTQPSSQPQTANSSSTTPAVGNVVAIAVTSTPLRPDATIRQAGLWTRFWLFLGCLSPEYTVNHQ
ncbi:WD40 repeat-like protein [Suillus hirtellus]|nr:WD40 repeat-like protein [Suillus hirtellus]